MSISIQQVCKKFGSFQAVEGVNLEIHEGGLVALLGPSGSGKSTLLRMIAGLERPDSGEIIICGQNTTNLDVRKRNIGFVFQHYALFKHMTIRENIAFGLAIRKHPRSKIRERVEELLELIQLKGLGDRYPKQLSGGQQQRVALARALAVQPKVLLLDEPFGALDAKIRQELRTWLRQLHEKMCVTTVFVTHDQEEAMEVADEIVIMNHGKVEQVGTSVEIYEHPASPFVMNFIGKVNILPSHASLFKNVEADNHSVFVRPHDIEVLIQPNPEATQAMVKRIINLGWEVEVELLAQDGFHVTVHFTRDKYKQLQLKEDQQVFIRPIATKLFAS